VKYSVSFLNPLIYLVELSPILPNKLIFLVLKFKFVDIPTLLGSPRFRLAEPLSPANLFFLKTILIIPAVPSALYLADGEVITSTFSTLSDGNCLSASLLLIPTKPEVFH
jgi:hypothetical protein